MDSKKFLEHIADDEGLTNELTDAEAKVLLGWLRTQIKTKVAAVKDEKSGWDVVGKLKERARGIAKTLSALCYDEEPAEAKKAWVALGHKQPLDGLPTENAVVAVKQLIAWEDASRVS